MSNIQIKNVDPDVHDAIRERAAAEGRTLSEYVLDLIRRDLRRPRRHEWLERARHLSPVAVDDDASAAIREDREEWLSRW